MSSEMEECLLHTRYRWLLAAFGFIGTIAGEDLWLPRSVTDIWLEESSTVAPGVNGLLAKSMVWEVVVGSANP